MGPWLKLGIQLVWDIIAEEQVSVQPKMECTGNRQHKTIDGRICICSSDVIKLGSYKLIYSFLALNDFHVLVL